MRVLLTLLLVLLAPLVSGLAFGQMLDPLARPSTRLGPTYSVHLQVSINAIDESELCGLFPLDREGNLQLMVGKTPIAKIALSGLTATEAAKKIASTIQIYFVRPPEVNLTIAKIPRIYVNVQGATFQRGLLALPEGSRLSDALAITQYQSSADLTKVQISRTMEGGVRQTTSANYQKFLDSAGEDASGDPILKNADQVTLLLSPVPVTQLTIGVFGEVRRTGFFPWKQGMRVRDAILEGFDLTPNADFEHVTIVRQSSNSTLMVNAKRAKENAEIDNLELRPNDVLYVPMRDLAMRYSIYGAVPAPQTNDFKPGITLTQAIKQAGGFKPGADRSQVMILGKYLNDPTKPNAAVVNYDKIVKGELPDPVIQPGDMINIPQRKSSPSPWMTIGSMLLRLLVF